MSVPMPCGEPVDMQRIMGQEGVSLRPGRSSARRHWNDRKPGGYAAAAAVDRPVAGSP